MSDNEDNIAKLKNGDEEMILVCRKCGRQKKRERRLRLYLKLEAKTSHY